MYESAELPVRLAIREAHQQTWQRISQTGSYWKGSERNAFVEESRNALSCELCKSRKQELSPNSVQGIHDQTTDLDPSIVDLVHRLRTDSNRFTRSVVQKFLGNHSVGQYIELVSVVASSVVIDTMCSGLGLDTPELEEGDSTIPVMNEPAEVEDSGAWVPLARQDLGRPDLGFRGSPNILRSLGSVPSAVSLFFSCFRPHYMSSEVTEHLNRSQVEFIASRVSAINECFY